MNKGYFNQSFYLFYKFVQIANKICLCWNKRWNEEGSDSDQNIIVFEYPSLHTKQPKRNLYYCGAQRKDCSKVRRCYAKRIEAWWENRRVFVFAQKVGWVMLFIIGCLAIQQSRDFSPGATSLVKLIKLTNKYISLAFIHKFFLIISQCSWTQWKLRTILSMRRPRTLVNN